jgi:predicted nucleic acid-binding protein
VSRAVVDASVWVAAVHKASNHRPDSYACLVRLRELKWQVIVPTIARVEIACALARRWRSPARARRMTTTLLQASAATECPLTPAAVERAQLLGTERFIAGTDAVYAAEAASAGMPLISWDSALIQRAGAMSPTTWLQANR